MVPLRYLIVTLLGLTLLAPSAQAQSTASPLRYMPDGADLLIEVPQPRRLVESLVGLDLLKQLQNFSLAREFLESTNARKFYQLVAYYETALDAKWPVLLDKLAGGGIALSVRQLGTDPAPALLVIQGRDAATVKKFLDLALEVIEQELARQENKAKFAKESYQGVETFHLGDGFYGAINGSTILLSTKEAYLKESLDLAATKSKKNLENSKEIVDAAKRLPKDAFAKIWLNMETARKGPGAAQLYTRPRDPAVAVMFGSYLDVFERSPYVCGAVVPEADGVALTFRAPAGRDGAGVERSLHMPVTEGIGTRPPLHPKSTYFSYSFYFDIGKMWEDREKIFNEQTAKGLEGGDKASAIFLSGAKLSKLMTQTAPYHRIVVVSEPDHGYTKKPKVTIPAFAFVTELREPQAFAKAIEPPLRSAALFGAFSAAKLKLVETTHSEIPIVSYRFPEDQVLKDDTNDIRFAFTPCFCRVGNQFITCSSLELCKELIDLLQIEAKEGLKGSPATSRMRLYADGFADLLQLDVGQLITQAVLDQALSADEAKAQVTEFLKVLRGLGTLSMESTFLPKEWQYTIRVKK